MIPRFSLLSVNSSIFIQLEIFHADDSIKELHGVISDLLPLILKSYDETLALKKIVEEIPQLKYISPQRLLCIEGDKPYPVLSLGGLVYTPDLISLLSKSYPQVLMDLHPFQLKLYDHLSNLDVSIGRSEDKLPCLILDIPSSFDDFYLLEIIQVIMDSGKSLEATTQVTIID
jgi:hypothetical protein